MTTDHIMKLEEAKNFVVYRAACDCSDSDCDMTIEMEIDEGFLILTLYKKLRWASHWNCKNWFHNIWLRIKASMKMLFTGYIEVEESFIMKEDQLNDFIGALIEGEKKLKE